MAISYKDIIITPNRGASSDPLIEFRGANSSVNTAINLKVYPTGNGTVSFEGSAGQLFSVTNDLSGTLFAVGDVSGIPLITAEASGTVCLLPYNSSGYVGIGTSSPVYTLDVLGTLGCTGLYSGSIVGGSISSTSLTNSGTLVNNGTMAAVPTGGVSNSATPGAIFYADYSAAAAATDYCAEFLVSASVSNSGRCIWSQGSTYGLGLFLGSTGGTGGYAYFQWLTRSTGAVISTPITISGITATPKVGIANTAPGHTLSVSGSMFTSDDLTLMGGANGINMLNATSNWIYWGPTAGAAPSVTARSTGTRLLLYPQWALNSQTDYAIGIGSSTLWFGVPATNAFFRWYANVTNIMTLSGGGDLTVTGQLNGATGSVSVPSFSFDVEQNTGMYRSGANTIAWTSNSVQRLVMATTALYPGQANTYNLGTGSNRWATIFAVNALNTSSDERIKVDIKDLNYGLNFVKVLRPVSYRMKFGGQNVETYSINSHSDSNTNNQSVIVKTQEGIRTHFGLISQDVQKVIPEGLNFAGWCLANTQDPESEQSLVYQEFIPPMIKAIQELSFKIDEITVELNQLRANN